MICGQGLLGRPGTGTSLGRRMALEPREVEGKAAGTGRQPGVLVTWQEGGGDKETELSGGWNPESREWAQDQL